MTSSNALERGFDKGLVKGRLDPSYICKLCGQIYRNTVQGKCGHRFCERCALRWLEENDKPGDEVLFCPTCREELGNDGLTEDENRISKEELYPDIAIRREVFRLPVKCINACGWDGTLKTYADHEPNCPLKKIQCECGKSILASKIKEHREKECDLRKVKCEYCQKTLVFKDHERHLETCEMVPFDCIFCGTVNILQSQEEEHYSTQCNTPTEKCSICGKRIPKGTEKKHVDSDVADHLIRIYKSVQDSKEIISRSSSASGGGTETTSKDMKDTAEKIKALESRLASVETQHNDELKLDLATGGGAMGGATGGAESLITGSMSLNSLSSKVDQLQKQVAVFDSIGSVLNQELMTCNARIDQIGQPSGGIGPAEFTQLQTRIRDLENELREKCRQMDELSVQFKALETTSHDGILLWKITDVNRRRQEARNGTVNSIYSPPFYSSRTGYKMCARLYFNGDGMGRNTHLSLFFVVMKGDYDSLLRWPFKQKVTLMLLDFNKREHITDAFRPDPSSTSFRQPVNNMNVASGCPLFCQLTKVDSPGTSLYIQDDTMFIKCLVDTSDL